MEKEEFGKKTEDKIERICSTAFLKDFVVRSPVFRKQSGRIKEAADFLIPFKTTMLAFQVKSRNDLKLSGARTAIDLNRIERIVIKGINQLNTLRRALNAGKLLELRNGQNIEVPYENQILEKVIGIVIFEIIGDEELPKEEQISIFGGYTFKYDMPINIFRWTDFKQILTEIDTLPDFIKYLDTRQALYDNGVLCPITEELDFLALYKTNPDLIQQCLLGQCDMLIVDENIWKSYQVEHRESIDRRTKLNKPSYLIDKIIEYLYTAIDFDSGVKFPEELDIPEHTTVEDYFEGVFFLNSLNRLERREIGKKFLEKMAKADSLGTGYSIIVNLEEKTAVLVLATDRSRQERVPGLYNLCTIAYCGLNLKRVIGIGSEPLSAIKRSYDICVIHDVEFQDSEELKSKFNKHFGSAQKYNTKEYGGND